MNWAFPLFLIYTHFTFFARFFFIAFLSCLPNCLRQFVSLLKTFPFFLLCCDICDINEVDFVLFLFVDWELKWLYKRLVLFYDSDWKCPISGGGLPNSISLCWNNWWEAGNESKNHTFDFYSLSRNCYDCKCYMCRALLLKNVKE